MLMKNLHSDSLALLSGAMARKIMTGANVQQKNSFPRYVVVLTFPLHKKKKETKKMAVEKASICLTIYAWALTKGIPGEMPCLHSTKYHLGLQVRGKKIQPCCIFDLDRSGTKS